jgi:prepilin-type N-terminal cleavage/methylation domain-containing protein
MIRSQFCPRRLRGFTLTELAIVLVIVALLIGGMLMPLSSQDELRRAAETKKTLADIQEALVGFAVANERLPCPATTASKGQESFAGGGNSTNGECSNFYDGYVPAAALGVTPIDENGMATDGWARPIRYAVYDGTINGVPRAFTRANGIKDAKMENIATEITLTVCSGAPPPAATSCNTADVTLTNKAPALAFSEGKPDAASGGDAQANRDADAVFVSHPPTPAGTANEFDDLVVWLSPNILFNRMIAAGRLP